ncbi:hypothetical protein UPYG_G00155980 [Umbra pygmaea]|uniref:Uncharacterized protein n=1 Tax=Umbra pygmaea TaxID=75934 RepID=A0ABD0WY69_UMBPY
MCEGAVFPVTNCSKGPNHPDTSTNNNSIEDTGTRIPDWAVVLAVFFAALIPLAGFFIWKRFFKKKRNLTHSSIPL